MYIGGSSYQEIDLDPYTAIQPATLIEGIDLPFDVFIKDKSLVIPLFNKGEIFDWTARDILREKGITEVYIRNADAGRLEPYRAKSHPPSAGPDIGVFNQFLHEREHHYLIDRSLLLSGSSVPFSIFEIAGLEIKRLTKASPEAPAVVSDSILHATGDLVIRKADISLYNVYIDSILKTGAVPEQDRVRIKSVAIKENSKIILETLFEHPRSGEAIKGSVTVVSRMVDSVLENKDALHDLLSIRTHDYYTYTHSVNVAVMVIGLGLAVGLSRQQVEKIGIGSLLHDLGKSEIPLEIINKPGRLDDREYEIMKTHVVRGEQLLRGHHDIPNESFVAMMQHHERLSGKGYPFGLAAGEVKLFGRITSIVDCYDALTTERSYKPANTPFFALSILTRQSTEYDTDLLKIFIKMLGEIKS